jgi:hypothetical protein
VLMRNIVPALIYIYGIYIYTLTSAFFLGGRRGTRTPEHFVNLTGESINFS